MNLTYTSAAKHAKCSPSTIQAMVAKGDLLKGPKRGRFATVVIADLDAFKTKVKAQYPKSGWHKRVAPKAAPRTKGSTVTAPPRPTGDVSNRLAALLAFTEIPLDKRPVLVELANRFSAVELRVLLKLADTPKR